MRRVANLIFGQKGVNTEEKLAELGILCLEKRRKDLKSKPLRYCQESTRQTAVYGSEQQEQITEIDRDNSLLQKPDAQQI